MTIHSTVAVKPGTSCYVDGSWDGAETGALESPFATILDAVAVSIAGDVIHVASGTYAEDVALAFGQDIDFVAAAPGSVVIEGSMVLDESSNTLENLSLIDDGAGSALHITGAGVDFVEMSHCMVAASAGGGVPVEIDATTNTVGAIECRFVADAAVADEVIRIESGVVDMRDCDVLHGDPTHESLVAEGDAATTFTAENCRFTGTVAVEAAVGAPAAFELRDCHLVAGAVSALTIAAGCTVYMDGGSVDCSDAAGDWVDGAGALVIGRQPALIGTADEVPATITLTRLPTTDDQVGVVAAAGASPQTDAVVLPQPYPDANYVVELTFEATGGGADDVICSVDQGTIATTGFSVVTTSAAAAAISGNVHWHAKRTA